MCMYIDNIYTHISHTHAYFLDVLTKIRTRLTKIRFSAH
jgi:hypothetical protein